MSTPNQPEDPYQSPDGGLPSYGGAQEPTPGQPGAYPSYPSEPYAATPMYGYPKNNLGVWALVLGLVGLVICSPAGIAAIIVGGNARKAVARGEANSGGMATAGIVLGWIAVAQIVLLIILAVTGQLATIFTF